MFIHSLCSKHYPGNLSKCVLNTNILCFVLLSFLVFLQLISFARNIRTSKKSVLTLTKNTPHLLGANKINAHLPLLTAHYVIHYQLKLGISNPLVLKTFFFISTNDVKNYHYLSVIIPMYKCLITGLLITKESVYLHMSSLCHLYVPICHLHVTYMSSIHFSLLP